MTQQLNLYALIQPADHPQSIAAEYALCRDIDGKDRLKVQRAIARYLNLPCLHNYYLCNLDLLSKLFRTLMASSTPSALRRTKKAVTVPGSNMFAKTASRIGTVKATRGKGSPLIATMGSLRLRSRDLLRCRPTTVEAQYTSSFPSKETLSMWCTSIILYTLRARLTTGTFCHSPQLKMAMCHSTSSKSYN